MTDSKMYPQARRSVCVFMVWNRPPASKNDRLKMS